MRLLMFTQKVDRGDDTLGIYHEWIRGLAARVEKLHVVCLFEGEHELPSNVFVHSLGKERGGGRFSYLKNFFRYLSRLRGEYDTVFVHMNKEYVLLGALFWKLSRKKIIFWYNHPEADWKARLAFFLANSVLHTSPYAASAKLSHAVQMPVGVVVPPELPPVPMHAPPSIVSIGRISKVKNIDCMLAGLAKLEEAGVPFRFDVYGAPVDRADDRDYFAALKRRAPEIHRAIEFHPPVPNSDVGPLFRASDVSLNLTTRGSMDKTIFESMAWGCPIVTSNPAVREIVGDFFCSNTAEDVAEKINKVLMLTPDRRAALREKLYAFVKENHSLPVLLDRLVVQLS